MTRDVVLPRQHPALACLATCLLLGGAQVARGQDFECDFADMVDRAVLGELEEAAPTADNNQAAPATSDAVVAEGAGRTNLLALAVDAGIVEANDNVTTLSLAPVFGFMALRDPTLVTDQQAYAEHDWARSLGVKLSAGGSGEKLDQDGDGMADDPLMTTKPSEILSYELSWQMGSRDLRDQVNYERLLLLEDDEPSALLHIESRARHLPPARTTAPG